MTEQQFLKNLQTPSGIVDAVLDTDAYNEIDDQFALSYMLLSEERINIKAITAAPFHNEKSSSPADGMEKSYQEILKVLDFAGKSELSDIVFRGSAEYLPDEKTPVKSDAADRIAELAKGYSPEKPLYVVAIGAITNVASALLLCPEIKENIVLVWLGGNSFDCTGGGEFNMVQDIAAARVVFGCGAPLVQLPCAGVVSSFITTGPELEYWLRGKGKLCDYLLDNVLNEMKHVTDRAWSRVIWDVTAVAWLLNDNERFIGSKIINAPLPEYDNSYKENAFAHKMRYAYYINRDELFNDLLKKIIGK